MQKPARFLRIFGVAGLLISLFAATIAPAVAQTEEPQEGLEDLFDFNGAGFLDGNNVIYYPWVANGEDFGLGASQTAITIQNLEDQDAAISIFVGDGAGDYALETTAYLSAFASKTFSGADLGIAEGSGAPVAVVSFAGTVDVIDPIFSAAALSDDLVETPVILSKPAGVVGESTQVIACVVNAYSDADDHLRRAGRLRRGRALHL